MLRLSRVCKHFGGVEVLRDVSFSVAAGQVFGLIGPNGAGKTTVFNLITGLIAADGGQISFNDQALVGRAPHQITRLGIARTFQNIELFEHASVLHNLLIGRHTHRQTGFWQDLFFTPSAREAELRSREKAEEVIDFLNLQHYRDTFVAGLPYGVRKVVEMPRALQVV